MDKKRQPQDRWFVDGDLRLHYLDWGNPSGTPLVFLHHLAGNAHYWDYFARNLRRDYHIIAVDNRGHGDSSWSGNYTPQQYATDLAKFIGDLDLKNIVLIGHSLGGINAIIYAGSKPQRLARLVIVDIGPEISQDGFAQFQKRHRTLPATFSSEEEFVRLMKPVEPYYSEEFVRHLAKNTMKRDASGRLIPKHDPDLFRVPLLPLEVLWPYLEKIPCPTLVVRGKESELLLPDAARRMVEVLPDGEMVEIGHAGHNVPGDNPEAFEAAVREFLAKGQN